MTHENPPFAVAVEAGSEGVSPTRIRAAIAALERFGVTIATFEDAGFPELGETVPRLDAVTQAAFAAPLSGATGLVPLVRVTAVEPFHLATQLATLDYASHGRAGWIGEVDGGALEAAAFDRAPLDGPESRRAELDDTIEVLGRLWDSWEDDAVIRDTATGRYLDRDKLHYADFEGARFSVKGPSIIPRPHQGLLPTFAVSGSAAPELIDVALIRERTVLEASAAAGQADTQGIKRTVVEVSFALDARGSAAVERVGNRASEAEAAGRIHYSGDSAGLAELITEVASFANGVRLLPADFGVDVQELGRAVLPSLRRAGVFASPRSGEHLRDALGLAHPVNRYAATAL
ncbi:LLM class flavin-dependent oxidoreductase [Pseudoclavibacter terrae]|uniref:LLM class flavin-dependent oxidoreductase n=1 Tax=Pseudoclavibacter terrae TaxID=1530195 RepID=A0A7J5B630_9MICO|nr:LLM class flavin-dependent oxidoreductase [Pseudoclavibacter terrae]KAB1639563.1 LLM class flavin-dependent oxidoreductase [Pseudoclavibacter terrae]